MKKLFYVLFAAMLCAGFAGCGSTDYKTSIVGSWTNYQDWDEGIGYTEYDEGEIIVRFKADGTGCWLEDGELDESFDWEIDGSALYMDYGDDDVEVIQIKTLNKKEMIFSYDGGESLEYYKAMK